MTNKNVEDAIDNMRQMLDDSEYLMDGNVYEKLIHYLQENVEDILNGSSFDFEHDSQLQLF